MSLWSIIGTGVGAALAPFTGGASLAIGSAIGQAADAHSAEKKAAKQEAAGFERGAQIYNPLYQVGGQAANSLAGYLGLPGASFPNMAGGGGAIPVGVTDQGSAMTAAPRSRISSSPGAALAAPALINRLSPSRPMPVPNGASLASYAGRMPVRSSYAGN